jgi:hypothetical protein
MTRVPFPGDIDRELSSKTRARGMGYTFRVTKPVVVILLVLVLTITVMRTFSAGGADTAPKEIMITFAKHLAATSISAGVLLLAVYIVCAPYKLYDRLASFFGRKQETTEK